MPSHRRNLPLYLAVHCLWLSRVGRRSGSNNCANLIHAAREVSRSQLGSPRLCRRSVHVGSPVAVGFLDDRNLFDLRSRNDTTPAEPRAHDRYGSGHARKTSGRRHRRNTRASTNSHPRRRTAPDWHAMCNSNFAACAPCDIISPSSSQHVGLATLSATCFQFGPPGFWHKISSSSKSRRRGSPRSARPANL